MFKDEEGRRWNCEQFDVDTHQTHVRLQQLSTAGVIFIVIIWNRQICWCLLTEWQFKTIHVFHRAPPPHTHTHSQKSKHCAWDEGKLSMPFILIRTWICQDDLTWLCTVLLWRPRNYSRHVGRVASMLLHEEAEHFRWLPKLDVYSGRQRQRLLKPSGDVDRSSDGFNPWWYNRASRSQQLLWILNQAYVMLSYLQFTFFVIVKIVFF